MGDVVFILTAVGFLGTCWLYVRGCDRIVSSEDEPAAPGEVRA